MLSKKAIDGIVILVPLWLNRAKGLLFIPFIVQAIGLDGYGTYIQIMANVALLSPFAHLALGQPILRFSSSVPDHDKSALAKCFWTPVYFCIIASSILISISAGNASWLSDVFLQGEYKEAIIVAQFMIFPNGAAIILLPYLNSRKRYREASAFWFIREFVPYSVLVAVVWIYNDLTLGVICSVLMAYIITLAMLVRIYLDIGIKWFSWTLLVSYVTFSWPIALASFARVGAELVPRYLIPAFLGSAVLGAFNVIYMLVKMMGAIADPFLRYLNSTLPRLWDSGEKERLQNTFERSVLLYLIMIVTALLILLELIGPAAALFIGDGKLQILGGMGLNLLILGAFAVYFGLNDFSMVYAKLAMQTGMVLSVAMLALVVTVVASAILIPNMGVIGASIGQLLGVIAAQQLYAKRLKREHGENYVESIIKLSAGTAMALILWGVLRYAVDLEWYAVLPMVVGTYLSLIIMLRVVTVSEVSQLLLKQTKS